jgi:hypothetical protein
MPSLSGKIQSLLVTSSKNLRKALLPRKVMSWPPNSKKKKWWHRIPRCRTKDRYLCKHPKMDVKRPKTSHTTYPVVDELWTMVKITPSGGEEV